MSHSVDLRDLLMQKQAVLRTQLAATAVHWHPNAKGDVGEANWQAMLDGRHGRNGFLPSRYAVSRAYVIDSDGRSSDEIDLVVHDAHFCPLLFEQEGHKYVPAESVYAAFEVKPELTRDYVLYAAEKIASVRGLHRTSADVIDVGVLRPPRRPFDILGGILTTRAGWSPPLGQPLIKALGDCRQEGRLDIGIAAEAGAFEAAYTSEAAQLTTSDADGALMHLLATLFTRLQRMGTVGAIDLSRYVRPLTESPTGARVE